MCGPSPICAPKLPGSCRTRSICAAARDVAQDACRLTEMRERRLRPYTSSIAHPPDSTSACSSTVCVAFSCLSGG